MAKLRLSIFSARSSGSAVRRRAKKRTPAPLISPIRFLEMIADVETDSKLILLRSRNKRGKGQIRAKSERRDWNGEIADARLRVRRQAKVFIKSVSKIRLAIFDLSRMALS